MKDGTIWRYMDTSRFISLLEDSALYFPNAVSFEDPFEGSAPLKNVEKRIEDLVAEYHSKTPFKDKYHNLTQQNGITFPNPEEFIETQVKAKIELREKINKKSTDEQEAINSWVAELNSETHSYYWERQNIFISCWHESDVESAAMWKLYSNNEHSVCIKSSISSLQECLGDDVKIDRVNYIDFTHDIIEELEKPVRDIFTLHKYKRRSFEHEREVRAMFLSMKHIDKQGSFWNGMPLKVLGESKPIDLNKLIDEIYIAPESPSWYLELIRKVVKRYELKDDIKVKLSTLSSDPVY